jgi:hypothetical protein
MKQAARRNLGAELQVQATVRKGATDKADQLAAARALIAQDEREKEAARIVQEAEAIKAANAQTVQAQAADILASAKAQASKLLADARDEAAETRAQTELRDEDEFQREAAEDAAAKAFMEGRSQHTPPPNPMQQPQYTPGGTAMNQQQMMEMFSAMLTAQSAAKVKSSSIQIVCPRVGGVDESGAWCGEGADGTGQAPVSAYCYRDFTFSDPSKRHSEATKVEKVCMEGLKSSPQYHFTMNTESDPNSLSTSSITDCLKEFETFAINTGMEGSFIIHTRNGDRINMFTDLGSLDEDVMSKWVHDLQHGVTTASGTVLPVCKQDQNNNRRSAQALLSSSSDQMRKHIRRTILEPGEMIGPSILWVIIQAIHTANPAMVRMYCTELTKMSIRDIPAENTQTMYAQVIDKCNQIRWNSKKDETPSDLANMATIPFTNGSDEGQRIEAKRLHSVTLQSNCKLTPEAALYGMVKAWGVNEPIGMYGPTAAFRLKGHSAFYSNQQPAQSNPQPVQSNPSVLNADQIKQVADYQAFQAFQASNGLHRSNPPSTSKPVSSGTHRSNPNLSVKDRHHLALIKVGKAQLPASDAIKDTDYFSVTDPQNNDEVIGEYCNICKRFYRKGFAMHWTGKHEKGKGKKASSNDSGAPTTSANLSVVQGSPALSEDQMQALAVRVAGLHAGTTAAAPDPAPAPQQATMFQLRGANYDTPVGPQAMNLCQTIQPGTAPAPMSAPMSAPSNFQPWGQVKDQGGQRF